MALVSIYAALVNVYTALVSVYEALVSVDAALVSVLACILLQLFQSFKTTTTAGVAVQGHIEFSTESLSV